MVHLVGGSVQTFFPPSTRVVALPSWTRPRLLVPATTLVERASASGFYPAFRVMGRVYRSLLRVEAVLALGAKRSATSTPLFVSEFVKNVLPGARVRAVQVGMPGSAQKCTLQLADDSGRVSGYLKGAESPLARQRLRDEFELLGRLPPASDRPQSSMVRWAATTPCFWTSFERRRCARSFLPLAGCGPSPHRC